MRLRTIASFAPAALIVIITILACNFGQAASPAQKPPAPQSAVPVPQNTSAVVEESTTLVPITPTSPVAHTMKPAVLAVVGPTVYDVESEGTAPENRAPYGDSYDINRFERPFSQSMAYLQNVDLSTYTVGRDNDWYYVSIAVVGDDPNDKLGIDYGVELDLDHDGFGDYIVWARPPYPVDWDTAPVQIFQDTNHDTGGLSAEKSDAPLQGNGYDKLVFNGGASDADPDMAWVRVNNGMQGLVQFAFKRSWAGNIFMLGVVADANWKDPGKMDYVDRITLVDAGSPVRDNKNYPLKALFAVDNICRSAVGFKPTGYEPQLCPVAEAPKRTPRPGVTPSACQPPAGGCGTHWQWLGEPYCMCQEVLY